MKKCIIKCVSVCLISFFAFINHPVKAESYADDTINALNNIGMKVGTYFVNKATELFNKFLENNTPTLENFCRKPSLGKISIGTGFGILGKSPDLAPIVEMTCKGVADYDNSMFHANALKTLDGAVPMTFLSDRISKNAVTAGNIGGKVICRINKLFPAKLKIAKIEEIMTKLCAPKQT
jgi:hypothetical protein